MAKEAKLIPSWFKEFTMMNEKDRLALVETVLYNVSCHGSLDHKPTEQGKQLVAWIKKEFDLVGVTPNNVYAKVRGSKKDLEGSWAHPWAMVTLVYKNRNYPFVIHVNAGMRKDKMLLQEIPFNSALFENFDVRGLTS